MLGASPLRNAQCPVEAGSPARQAAAQRRLVLTTPQALTPTLCTRFAVHANVPPSSPIQQQVRDRTVAAPASLYTSRQDVPVDGAARRVEDEHSATQLILLLTLSVVLLTLPWVVDHPVTLLVPLALLVLPFTSGALRSMVAEGFTLIAAGLRWFWRHRNTAPNVHRQPAPQAGHQSAGAAWHQPVVHPLGARMHSKGRGTHMPQPQPARLVVDHRAAPQPVHMGVPAIMTTGAEAVPCERRAPSMRMQLNTMGVPMAPSAATGAPPICQLPTSAAHLATPDLDFDSDGEGSKASCALPWGAVGHDRAAYRSPPPRQRHNGDDAAECTVYNWDVADECAHRRGHRPLSELLSNGQ